MNNNIGNNKISVIVPIYNSERYLSECVSSILNQTYTNFELILVDDGSYDSSFEICTAFKNKDNRILLIRKKNGGSSSARNYGLSLATGAYITFIDSDDYVSPRYLELLLNNLLSNNSGASMACEIGFCSINNSVSQEIYTTDSVSENVNEINYLKFCKSKGLCDMRKLFKKELFRSLRFDERLGYGEDFCLMYQMACLHPHLQTTELGAIYYYRRYAECSSTTRWQNSKMTNTVIFLLKAYRKNYKSGKSKIDDCEFYQFMFFCFRSRFNYCIKHILMRDLLKLVPARIIYFKKNKSIKNFIYCFFPLVYRLILLKKRLR